MLSDREYLEQRLELFVSDPWQTFKSELISMAESLDKIQNIDDEEHSTYVEVKWTF